MDEKVDESIKFLADNFIKFLKIQTEYFPAL